MKTVLAQGVAQAVHRLGDTPLIDGDDGLAILALGAFAWRTERLGPLDHRRFGQLGRRLRQQCRCRKCRPFSRLFRGALIGLLCGSRHRPRRHSRNRLRLGLLVGRRLYEIGHAQACARLRQSRRHRRRRFHAKRLDRSHLHWLGHRRRNRAWHNSHRHAKCGGRNSLLLQLPLIKGKSANQREQHDAPKGNRQTRRFLYRQRTNVVGQIGTNAVRRPPCIEILQHLVDQTHDIIPRTS